jgi:hypothetical protein
MPLRKTSASAFRAFWQAGISVEMFLVFFVSRNSLCPFDRNREFLMVGGPGRKINAGLIFEQSIFRTIHFSNNPFPFFVCA